jgi:UDP-GlcNAc:undecaprenyl-phosphate/decaprenyl-phosphate GlcNAc-1-phosphate transferase
LALFFLGLFLVSVLTSFVLTRQVRNLAMQRGWISAPTSDRHIHSQPLPRLGGVAIFAAFLISVAIVLLLGWHWPAIAALLPIHSLLAILAPGVLIFALGLWDDLRPLSPWVKFAVQAIAACLLFGGGLRVGHIPLLFGHHQFSWIIGLPLTILWVLAVTNAFNLIDGLDGLAAGSALFSTLVVFVVSLLTETHLISLLTLALAGAILGLLRFNFNPATIFLGDCGSLFIGFILSAVALEGAQKAPTIVAVAIPVVSFGLPILETALSVLRRFIAGKPLFTADREHIHHKLLERGFTHRQVVIVLYAVSALFGLLSLFLLWPGGSSVGLVLAVLGLGVWIGVQHLGYLEFDEIRRVAQRTMDQRQVFVHNLAIRRAVEELRVVHEYDHVCQILRTAFSHNDFDGFNLQVSLRPNEFSLIPTPRTLRWSKPGFLQAREDAPAAWSLNLDLLTTGNFWRGTFKLYREYTERPLLVDISMLTSVFPVVLADALDRAMAHACSEMPKPLFDEIPTYAAAQAD